LQKHAKFAADRIGDVFPQRVTAKSVILTPLRRELGGGDPSESIFANFNPFSFQEQLPCMGDWAGVSIGRSARERSGCGNVEVSDAVTFMRIKSGPRAGPDFPIES